jgi:hypothetical protein
VRFWVLFGLSVACGRQDRDREARELAALDVAAASARVQRMVDSCQGFTRALDSLTRTHGATLAGLVEDAVSRARARCADPADAISGAAAPHQLARSLLADDHPEQALTALAPDETEPAVCARRADLLDRLGRPRDALTALGEATTTADSPKRRLLEIAIAVRRGSFAQAAHAIAAAPLVERPQLAFRAAADTPPGALAELAAAAVEPELAIATADRLEQESGPAVALSARQRAATLAPDRAEPHDALARAQIAAGRPRDAVAAWDRAAALAPAQPSYRLAAVRALVALGDGPAARDRVAAWAAAARVSGDIDELLAVSTAAQALPDYPLSVALARDARTRRPGDGRLAFELAARLADAGERAAAAQTYVELLACGAHAQVWHRHEVAARLIALVTDASSAKLVLSAIEAAPPCAPVDPDDLARYVTSLRARLKM